LGDDGNLVAERDYYGWKADRTKYVQAATKYENMLIHLLVV